MMIFLVLAGVLLGGIAPSHGQICPITGVTAEVAIQRVRDVENLFINIEGEVNGGTPSNITWLRNDFIITDSTEVPDGGSFSIFNNVFPNSCLGQTASTSLSLIGRLPGNYTLSASNVNTTVPKTASIIIPESGPVSNLTLKQVDGTKVEASWIPPSNNVVDYRVFVNDNHINGDGIIVNPSSNPTYTTPNGYDVDQRVAVHVRATTEYYWSDTVHRPIKIRALLSPEISSTSTPTEIRLYISQPRGSLRAHKYYATLTTDDCIYDTSITKETDSHRVDFENLKSGISYTVNVTALNLDTGLMSNVTETVSTRDARPSSSPGIPSVVSATSTTVTLNWTALPCESQHGNITNYAILYGIGLTSSTIVRVNTSSPDGEYAVTNLLPSTYYNFRVAAVNSAGEGPFSNSSELVRTEEMIPSGAPGTPFASAKTATSVTLTWTSLPPTEQNGVITYYIVQYGEGSSLNRELNVSSTYTTLKFRHLSPFTEYTFSVAALNGAGVGPFSVSSPIQTDESTPSAVRNLTVYPRFESLLVVWLEPEPSNGIITSYSVSYTVDGLEENGTSNITSFIIEDLIPDTELSEITVVANTAVGAGPETIFPYTIITRELPIPQILKVIIHSSNSVEVTWGELNYPNITVAIRYEWTLDGQEYGPKYVPVPATKNTIVIDDLISGAEYTFEVLGRIEIAGVIVVGPSSATETVTLPTMITTTSAARKSEGASTAMVLAVVMAASTTMDFYSLMLASVGAFHWVARRFTNKYLEVPEAPESVLVQEPVE